MRSPRDFTEVTEVRGLRELQRELRSASPEMAKKLQQVNKRLVENVASDARGEFYSRVAEVSRVREGPVRAGRRSGAGSISRSRASIRAAASGQRASVKGGGPKAPGFMGHEFGGGSRPRTRQFPDHRGLDGYVLYPAVRRHRKTAGKSWEAIFDELFGQQARTGGR